MLLLFLFVNFGLMCSSLKESDEIGDEEITVRIIRGEEAGPSEFAFTVRIVFVINEINQTRATACTGNLIHQRFIVSAAHCYFKDPPRIYNEILVSVGSNKKYENPNPAILLKECRKPKTYNYNTRYGDIMVCELMESANLSDSVQTACLHSIDTEISNDQATAVGWGCVDYKGTKSEVLRSADLKILPKESCEHKVKGFSTRRMICAGDPHKLTGTCKGDSGGPLFIYYQDRPLIIGIISKGVQKLGYPRAITRVAAYTKWIISTLPKDIDVCVM